MIVNYSAGGGTDLSARAFGDAIAKALGGNITVTNLPGGTGSLGVTELANSKADGYTIGVATLAPLALVPYQLDVTYTPDSFQYLCAFGQYGYGIVVAKDSPYQTLDDLIEAAKESPISFGSHRLSPASDHEGPGCGNRRSVQLCPVSLHHRLRG